MEIIWITLSEYLNKLSQLPKRIEPIDIIEIILISFLIYHVMLWIRNTRAWVLVKGMAVLLALTLIAVVFQMNTIMFLAEKTLGIGVTAIIIVFQPELRKALEQLGRKRIVSGFFSLEDSRSVKARFKDKTITELIKASFELSKTKTGALIVIEREDSLGEYDATGIELDAAISSQLLINIFEHNTPLHDGAVIIRGDRVVAATCYLPLSDSTRISKELGTRHRAGLGISECTDSLTIIVSEETGKVSVAYMGELYRNLDSEGLSERLTMLQDKVVEEKKFKFLRGLRKK